MMKIKMMINIGLQKIKLTEFPQCITILIVYLKLEKFYHFHQLLMWQLCLNNNKPLGTLEMGVLYSKIPESIKNRNN